jgi:hypothetical protein
MKIKIIRETKSPACIGNMEVDGLYFGVTLERPWLDNRNSISSIPAGIYEVEFTRSPKFKRLMLEVLKVPNREGIRIHSANFYRELEGCLAVGGMRTENFSIVNSKVEKLEDWCLDAMKKGEKITLEIVNAWPEVTV